MPTRTSVPHARRYRPLLLLVGGLLVMLAIGSGLSGATDPPCKDDAAASMAMQRVMAPTAMADRDASADRAAAPTGLDLEVRVWNLKIEFPWLKSLPLRPGRHVVIRIFELARP